MLEGVGQVAWRNVRGSAWRGFSGINVLKGVRVKSLERKRTLVKRMRIAFGGNREEVVLRDGVEMLGERERNPLEGWRCSDSRGEVRIFGEMRTERLEGGGG